MSAAVPLYGYQRRWLLDKSRFKAFLPPEDAELANAGGGDASK